MNRPGIDIELERHVLGEILSAGGVEAVADFLRESAFGDPKHRKIFGAMLTLFGLGTGIDSITVSHELARMGCLPECGGESYLVELGLGVTSDGLVLQHARLLAEQGMKRELYALGMSTASAAADPTTDSFQVLEDAEMGCLGISGSVSQRSYRKAGELLPEVMDKIDAIHRGEKTHLGIPTGFERLDAYTGGLETKQLYVIAARPSQGKTSLLLSMAANIAPAEAIAIQSLEMNREELMLRLLSIASEISYYRIKSARFDDDQGRLLAEGMSTIANWKLYIDDSAGVSLTELGAKARRLKNEYGIRGLFIDYLGLMRAPRAETRDQAIGALTRGLKELAKQLDIFVVLISQLNRGVEMRADKKPMLSDLRESGNIEQDADVVLFVHRPEYYGVKELQGGRSSEGIANLILAKQRNGATGEFEVEFVRSLMRFQDRRGKPGDSLPDRRYEAAENEDLSLWGRQ